MTAVTAHARVHNYAIGARVIAPEVTAMLLLFMILCAVAAILLFSYEAFEDLHDSWKHPDHRAAGEDPHRPTPKHR